MYDTGPNELNSDLRLFSLSEMAPNSKSNFLVNTVEALDASKSGEEKEVVKTDELS